jgi:hypothetical protein
VAISVACANLHSSQNETPRSAFGVKEKDPHPFFAFAQLFFTVQKDMLEYVLTMPATKSKLVKLPWLSRKC